MESFLNMILIAAILVIGIALWQTWKIIKKGKHDEKLSQKDAAKVDRWLSVLQVGIYVIVVVIVIRFYLSYIS